MPTLAVRTHPRTHRYHASPMRAVMTILESVRIPVRALTVPYAFAWADGPGKPLLVLAFGLLILLHLSLFDTRTILAGARPRLGLTRDRDLWSPAIIDRARAIAGVLIGLIVVLLLFVSFGGAVVVAIAAGLVLLMTGGVSRRAERWRMLFAEVLWPALMLIVPMGLFSWILADRGVDTVGSGRAATGVGALVLAAYVLLCQVRDQRLDTGQGQRTLATIIGRGGATLVLFLVLAALLIVSARGAGMGMWEWWPAAIAGIASLVAIWSVASEAIDGAPSMWAAAGFVIALGVV